MKVSTKEVKAESEPKAEASADVKEEMKEETSEPAAAEDVTMKEETESEPKAKEEEPKKKRKQRKSKKVELDEEGNPIQKKKRKLNHQCAAVKVCHAIMQKYREDLPEEDQCHLSKFCQLNRRDQGVMFYQMVVKMRAHLKEKYPELEKWEDMDFEEEDKRDGYNDVVLFLLDEFMEKKRKEPITEKQKNADLAREDDKDE
jgi:hypothetical protein